MANDEAGGKASAEQSGTRDGEITSSEANERRKKKFDELMDDGQRPEEAEGNTPRSSADAEDPRAE